MRRVFLLSLAAAAPVLAQPAITPTTTISPLIRIILTVGVLLVFIFISWLILRRMVSLRNEVAEAQAAERTAGLVARMLISGVPLSYEAVEELIDSARREYSVQLRRLTVADLLEDVQADILADEYILPRQKGDLLEVLRGQLDEAQKKDVHPRKKRNIKGLLKRSLAAVDKALKEENLEEARRWQKEVRRAALEAYRFGAAFNPLYDALTLARKHPGVALFGGLIYFGMFLASLIFVWSL